MGRLYRHVRSNVVAYVALFFALSGGAYALQGKNTVDSGDIKNGQVKTKDVANDGGNGALKGADIAANALTGKDIFEASLGRVPRAQNADALEGQDASAFLSADAVKSGRQTVTDPEPGDAGAQFTVLVATNSFSLDSTCAENLFGTTDEAAGIDLGTASEDSISVSAWDSAGSATNDPDVSTSITMLDLREDFNAVRSVYFVGVAPNGAVISGSVSAEVNDSSAPGTDCTFAWKVIVS